MNLAKLGMFQEIPVQTINITFNENTFDGSRFVSWLQTDSRAGGQTNKSIFNRLPKGL
jgi:hypothetical protein